jgi:ABC-type hemin transport system ATPase subunit
MAMNGQRPDVTDEEIGMRTFQLRKARAVERATDRMRQGLGKEWSTLSGPEIEAIGYALGELWAYIAHSEWDDLRFSTLDIDDARTILDFARELVDHQRNSVEVLKDVHTLIVSQG